MSTCKKVATGLHPNRGEMPTSDQEGPMVVVSKSYSSARPSVPTASMPRDFADPLVGRGATSR